MNDGNLSNGRRAQKQMEFGIQQSIPRISINAVLRSKLA
jgi:hypothetical protein